MVIFTRILVSGLLLMLCSKSYGYETKQMLETTLDSFKKNDLNLYMGEVMISQAELSEMIEYAISEASTAKLKKRLLKESSVLPINYPEYRRTVTRNWTRLYKRAEDEGLNWKSVSIVKFLFKPNASSKLINIQRGDFIVTLQSEGELFSFRVDDCIKTLTGNWKCFDPTYFRREVTIP